MTCFTRKNIDSIESLGEILVRHREYKGVSLERAAAAIQVDPKYLRLLEADDYRNMPEGVYMKNFLKRYADFLNIGANLAILIFEKEKSVYFKTIVDRRPKIERHPILKRILHYFQPNFLKYYGIAIVSIAVFVYLGLSVNRIFAKPELIIKNPTVENLITAEKSIKIEGVTEREVELFVNSERLLGHANGEFEFTVDLQNGLNVIAIEARKKHSRPNIVYRRIIVKDDAEATPVAAIANGNN
jgi:cytoskeletal protein RodZ